MTEASGEARNDEDKCAAIKLQNRRAMTLSDPEAWKTEQPQRRIDKSLWVSDLGKNPYFALKRIATGEVEPFDYATLLKMDGGNALNTCTALLLPKTAILRCYKHALDDLKGAKHDVPHHSNKHANLPHDSVSPPIFLHVR